MHPILGAGSPHSTSFQTPSGQRQRPPPRGKTSPQGGTPTRALPPQLTSPPQPRSPPAQSRPPPPRRLTMNGAAQPHGPSERGAPGRGELPPLAASLPARPRCTTKPFRCSARPPRAAPRSHLTGPARPGSSERLRASCPSRAEPSGAGGRAGEWAERRRQCGFPTGVPTTAVRGGGCRATGLRASAWRATELPRGRWARPCLRRRCRRRRRRGEGEGEGEGRGGCGAGAEGDVRAVRWAFGAEGVCAGCFAAGLGKVPSVGARFCGRGSGSWVLPPALGKGEALVAAEVSVVPRAPARSRLPFASASQRAASSPL